MANNRLVVQSGQSAGAIIGTYDIFGTNAGAETVTVYDGTTANFQGDFSRGGDTIRLTDLATDFTVQISGSNAILTSVSDGITVVIPIGTVGTKIVFENAAGQLVDERVLIFNGANVLLGAQTVTGTATQVANTGGGNSTNTIILTPGLDNVTAGTADDTFLAFNTTLNAGDNLDGGAGYNTLKIATDGSLTVQNYGGFTTTNIQRVELTNDDNQPVSIDLSGTKGVEIVAATNSSQSIAFNQLTTLAAIELNNVTNPAIGGPDVTVQYQDSLTAGADTVVNVVLKTSKSDDLTIGSVSDANGGIETVNLSVVEGNSTLDTLNTDLTNLNITGTKNLVIDDSLNNTVRNIDASGLTGTLDIDFADNDLAGTGVTMKGAQGANTILGGNAADNITTYAGDDFITTDDAFGGTDGNDTVDAGNGNNTVISGNGSDSITTGTGNDVIDANNGNNIVNAGDGNNSVTTGTGIDTITTGSGNDTISSGSNNDLISSGAGNDFITIGAGEHTITAGDGDDTVVAGANFNASTIGGNVLDDMDFGAGTDELRISASNSSADTFENVSNLEVLTLTAKNLNVNLNPGVLGANEAQAAGINTINTDWNYTGNDTVDAGSFTSALTVNIGGYTGDTNGTGGGVDSIVTGSGADTINAFGDNNITDADTIIGGAGVDTLNLDGDTTLTTASNFSGIEVITLDDNEDPIATNSYDISVDNDNAPTANGTLTIDGTKLQSDEGARISTLAVTAGVAGYNASILGGAGADTVISGIRGDTIKTGAGNDTVDIGQAGDFGGADSIELGTGDDTLLAARNLASNDTIIGGEGTDTMSIGGINYFDVDFTNVTEFEILNVAEGFTSTLSKEAQEAGFQTIVSANGTAGTVIDTTGFTRGVVIDISATTGGGLNNDVVRAGSGNDTVIAGVGNQNVSLGAGDDQIWVNGSEFDINDTLAGGDGNDTVVLDNTGSNAVNPVIVGVNLDIVTGIENFVIKSSGDRNVGTDADANQITFENGDIGTLTNINVNASALSDPADSLKVVLAASLDDDDYMFTITGSSTQTIVEKLNLGVDNNVSFIGGTGVDTLIINGGDLGSTISMDGGAGDDVIAQSGGLLTDDGFVNVSNVEVLTGSQPGTLNAVLGGEADQAGIVRIEDTTGNDRVILDAAFNNDLRINLAGGDDSFSGANSNSKITFDANGALTAADTLVGGKGVSDTLIIGAETANITNVSKVEIITVENVGVAQTTTITTSGSNTVSAPAAYLQVNATALDSADHLVFTQTVTGQAISLDGGAGADTITTQGTSDIINAGDGNDVINAGDGNNTVNAGSGNDSVVTGSGNDVITGGDGNDTIFSNGGNDSVDGGAGDDMISTGAGADTIISGTGVDQIFGGIGGDTIILTADGQKDSVFYTQRLDSSTSNNRDTITGFESGTDIIDVRYVAELLSNIYPSDPDGPGGPLVAGDKVYTAGVSQLQFLGNFSEFGGAQGALTTADPTSVGIVFQQDTNTLWVDLNNDNVLNGDDLQIVLSGVTSVKAEDVLSGALVGQTNVPSNTATVGTIINERFVLINTPAPAGKWTLDGGLGSDTVVAAAGQDISAVNGTVITNVEWLEIGKGAGGVTIDGAQYNQFLANEQAGTGGFVATGAAGFPQVLNFLDTGVGGKIVGTSGVGVDAYNLSNGNDDFQIGHVDQDVNVGGGNNIVRTQAAGAVKNSAGDLDDIDGTITLGAGTNTLILDDGDNYSGATILGGSFTTTIITESSVTMTAQQHGTDGTNGLFGNIVDAGDTGTNSPDTITISNNTNSIGGVTAHVGIENYILASNGNDVFRVSSATNGVNVTASGTGADTVILLDGVVIDGNGYQPGGPLTTIYQTGQYSFGANDTLQINGTVDIRGMNNGNATTFGALNLAAIVGVNTVSLTEAQHDAIGAANITGGGANDVINLYAFDVPPVGVDGALDNGVVTGSTTIGTYNLNGLFDFTLGANFQDAIGDGANSQTVRVNNRTLTAASTLSGGTGAGVDALVLTGTNDISLATVDTFESITIDGSTTMTEGQYELNGAINATGFNDTITLVLGGGNGVVTGDADIQNFVLNGAFDFTLGAAAQNVTGSDGADQTVRITGLTATGAINGGAGGNDTLVLGNGTDISGATITNFENVNITGSVTMTYAQYLALNPVGTATTDTITLTGTAQPILARTSIENYVLANTSGNDFSFVDGTGTLSVVTSGSNNDIVRTGTQTSFTGVTLNLAGNSGFVGDTLFITTTGTDISGINGGAETTAETINIVANGTVSMTVAQHEGFTAPFIATGVETVIITDDGLINAEEAIENYDLSADVNTIVVNELNGAVNIVDTTNTGDGDTVVINKDVVATGTWNLTNTNDVLEVNGTGTKVSGVNGGAATSAESLVLAGAINGLTLTQTQHEAFTSSTATAGADTLIIIGAGTVTAFDNVENYNLSNAANTLIVNANETNVNILAVGGSSDKIDVGGNKVGGNWSLGALADTIVAANGADISGVNTGSATTAEVIQIANNASVTMSVAQHQAFAADGLGGFQAAGTNTITLSNDGTIDARSQVEKYVLNGDGAGGSTVNINDNFIDTDSNFDVSIDGAGGADTIVVNTYLFGPSVTVTGDWNLAGADDTLVLNSTTNLVGVNNGAKTTAETLTIQAGSGFDATMTVDQHNGFTTLNATGAGNQITLKTDGTLTAFAAIEAYVLNNDGGTGSTISVNSGNTAVSITGASGSDTIDVGGLTVTGKFALTGADDTLTATDGSNVTAVNSGAATTAETLDLTGVLTLTALQFNGFTAAVGAGTDDGVIITKSGTFTAFDAIEDYTLAAGSTITFDSLSDTVRAGQSVTLATGAGVDRININVQAINGGSPATGDGLTINNFNTAEDRLHVTADGLTLESGFVDLAAGNNQAAGAAEVVVINGLAGVDLTDVSNFGEVEFAIGNAVGTIDAGRTLFVLENVNGSGQSGIYAVNVQGAAATSNLDASNFDVELVAIIDHTGAINFTAANFV